MNKISIFCLFLSINLLNASEHYECSGSQPICTDAAYSFQQIPSGQYAEGGLDGGNNYVCETSRSQMSDQWIINPEWFTASIAVGGSMVITISSGGDVDFVMWGPYDSIESALNACGSLPQCYDGSYSGSSTETIDFNNVSVGDVFVLMITNYESVQTELHLSKTSGDAEIDCSVVAAAQGVEPEQTMTPLSEAGPQCDNVTFYSECNYDGESVEIADMNECIDWSPQSICIPDGMKVTVYNLCNFQGQTAVFHSSVECLSDIDYSMLSNMGITLNGKKDKLRHSEKEKEFKLDYQVETA